MPDGNMQPAPEVGRSLATLRKAAGISQSEIGKKIGSDASRVSRIESGELMPSLSDVLVFLESIETTKAQEYRELLTQQFRHLDRPSFDHPDRKTLLKAERLLQRLDEFQNLPGGLSELLSGAAELHRKSLLLSATFLSSVHHNIGFLGRTGVGKTVAICRLTGLLLTDPENGTKRPALEAGTGGTTIGEVHIKRGDPGSIRIEPMPNDEITKLVDELCAGLRQPAAVSPEEDREQQVKSIPEEFRRALINMAKLAPRTIRVAGKKPVRSNPLKELVDEFPNERVLRAKFEERLALDRRTEREIRYDPNSRKQFSEWLATAYSEINNGRNPGFSIPRRIEVSVPSEMMAGDDRFTLEVIDTKGIDAAVTRPDLQACIDDERTLVLLCSTYSGAPEPPIHDFLQYLARVGSERALQSRVGLLVLHRNREPLETKDLDGTMPSSIEEGCSFKEEQIRESFKRIGVPEDLPVLFFDAMSEQPEEISRQILALISEIRASHVNRIEQIGAAIDQLVEQKGEELLRLAEAHVLRTLETFWREYRHLPAGRTRTVPIMLQAVQEAHARSVWATTRRNGKWPNIHVFLQLGIGARTEAQFRSRAAFDALMALLRNMLGQDELAPVRRLVTEVQANIPNWREQFLEAVKRAGETIFHPALSDDDDLWAECEDIYGRGRAFRQEVATLLEQWFETEDRLREHELLQRTIQQAWTEQVLKPLAQLCGKSLPSG